MGFAVAAARPQTTTEEGRTDLGHFTIGAAVGFLIGISCPSSDAAGRHLLTARIGLNRRSPNPGGQPTHGRGRVVPSGEPAQPCEQASL